MTPDVPAPARALAHLIPAGDRGWILGDLVEDADDRGLRGAQRTWWLAFECATIAAGLSAHRARNWLVLAPMREIAAGLAVDGRGALRGIAAPAILRTLLLCGSIVTLSLGVEILVRSLLLAAGLQ